MVIDRVWTEYARKVTDITDRNILTTGMILMITDPVYMKNEALRQTFPKMFSLVIEIFKLSPEKDKLATNEAKEFYIHRLEDQGFGAAFCSLAYCKVHKRLYDPTIKMTDPRQLLAQRLAKVVGNNRD